MSENKLNRYPAIFFSLILLIFLAASVFVILNPDKYIFITLSIIALTAFFYYKFFFNISIIIFIVSLSAGLFTEYNLFKNIQDFNALIQNTDIYDNPNNIQGNITFIKIIDQETARITLENVRINKIPLKYKFSLKINNIPDLKKIISVSAISFCAKIYPPQHKKKSDLFLIFEQKNIGYAFLNFSELKIHSREKNFFSELQYLIYVSLKNSVPYPLYYPAYSIITGDTSGFDRYMRDSFQKSGIIHIMAISGLHTAIIAGSLFYVLFFLKRNYKYFTVCLFIWIYCLFAGCQPSVLRAVTALSFFFIGKFLNRDSCGINMLAVSFLIILIFSPENIFNPGFQLSYASALGIILSLEFISEKFHPVIKLMLCTIGVQIFILPIVSFHFGNIPLAGAIVNLIAIPLFSILLPLLCLIIMSYFIFPGIAKLLALPFAGVFKIISKSSDFFLNCGYSLNHIEYTFSFLKVIIYYAILSIIIITALKYYKYFCDTRLKSCNL